MGIEEIDRIVCEWSMQFGVAMSDLAQKTLVDRLALAATPLLDPVPCLPEDVV